MDFLGKRERERVQYTAPGRQLWIDLYASAGASRQPAPPCSHTDNELLRVTDSPAASRARCRVPAAAAKAMPSAAAAAAMLMPACSWTPSQPESRHHRSSSVHSFSTSHAPNARLLRVVMRYVVADCDAESKLVAPRRRFSPRIRVSV